MSQAQGQPDFELDEDLFDFAGVVPEPAGTEEDLDEIFASFRDASPAEELLDMPVAALPAAKTAATAPVPEPIRAAQTERAERARAAKPAVVESGASSLEPSVAAPRPSRLSKSVLAIALGVTVLNSTLAVVVLRGRSGDAGAHPKAITADSEHAPESDGDAHAASPRGSTPLLPEPEELDPENALHAHPTLDGAREQISRGEYATARQRVYGLLAIIDRLDDPRRGALEADCQFLIAQSLHLEALARMGAPE